MAFGFGPITFGSITKGLGQLGAIGTAAGIAQKGISEVGKALGFGGSEQGQAVAIEAPKQTVAAETQASGTYDIAPVMPTQAAIGGILPSVAAPALRTISRFVGSPAGGLATGVGAGLLGAALAPSEPSKIRFTRKQQMQVKEMVELLGFDGAMQVLGVDASTLAFMLTKKFPRRGQGITAAQLRNAQRVNNKIVHMHDKLKSSFGAATRRTTARRSTTRVTQIKN